MNLKSAANKFIKFLMLVVTAFSLMTYRSYASSKDPCRVYRLSGVDRFETAANISREGWTRSEYVVLAAGEGNDRFADALTGSSIAHALGAPLLLTERKALNTYTKEEILRLQATNAILLGGFEVIGKEVEEELEELDIETTRIRGRDRYETAIKVAENIWEATHFSEVFITTGEKFQYAMMIAPFACKNNMPILLTNKNKLDMDVKRALERWEIERVHIIGGTDIISEDVEKELKKMDIKVRRTKGESISEINIKVINRYKMGTSRMGIAREDIFTDSLGGAAFAALKNMPVLLAGNSCPDKSIQNFLKEGDFEEAYIFGGEKAVPNYMIDLILKKEVVLPCEGIPAKDAFKSDGRKIAFLTFDDGPSKNVTPLILDILNKYDIKATFFVVGRMAKNNKDIVKRAYSEGHSIANHSYSHEYSSLYRSVTSFLEEVKKCETILKDILGEGYVSKLFRFPGGSFGDSHSSYKKALAKEGYEYINWNALNGDAEGSYVSSEKLIQRVKDTVSGKDRVVILMHDLGSKKSTVEALPAIIEYLQSEGYEFHKLI